MKYIEELNPGDSFSYENRQYLLSSDFKSEGSRLSVSIVDGNSRWFKGNEIVNVLPLFTLDKDNNIIPIKS